MEQAIFHDCIVSELCQNGVEWMYLVKVHRIEARPKSDRAWQASHALYGVAKRGDSILDEQSLYS
jgi:hypothetical protein